MKGFWVRQVCGEINPKSITLNIRIHVILNVMAYIMGHTIVHRSVSHAIIMPTIYIINNVPSVVESQLNTIQC